MDFTELQLQTLIHIPVSVDEAGVNVVGPLHASDWLQTHTAGLEGHDVDQSVLEFVARQTSADESRGVCFRVGQFLQREKTHAIKTYCNFQNSERHPSL